MFELSGEKNPTDTPLILSQLKCVQDCREDLYVRQSQNVTFNATYILTDCEMIFKSCVAKSFNRELLMYFKNNSVLQKMWNFLHQNTR